MNDPVSILLIIGSAVVGPIEARCNSYEFGINCVGTETLAQTCARAMKDIGAVQRGIPFGKTSCLEGHDCWDPPKWVTKDGETLVRCIPAPRGLK